jgi:hypothetical protein
MHEFLSGKKDELRKCGRRKKFQGQKTEKIRIYALTHSLVDSDNISFIFF